ncbi:MAG: polysaccharide deacetylase family protein [Verrucomicrobia bacterium]|nr:polysaccharide deacetylase family protein [Cytophagales bacterium]
MFLHKTNAFLKLFFPEKSIWKIPKSQPTLYLTFDDGPLPDTTEWVLKVLEKYQIKATFFCVGDNIQKYQTVYQNLENQGHQTANHTQNHLRGWKTQTDLYVENTIACQKMMQKEVNLFRPPYGLITRPQAQILQQKGYKIVMWDVLSGDFEKSVSPETCLKKTIQYTENGSVIVFHDSTKAEKNLKFTLPRYLDFCKEKGYIFETL